MALKPKQEREERDSWINDIPDSVKNKFTEEYMDMGTYALALKYKAVRLDGKTYSVIRYSDPHKYEEYFKTTPYYFDTFGELDFEIPFNIFQGIYQACYSKIISLAAARKAKYKQLAEQEPCKPQKKH